MGTVLNRVRLLLTLLPLAALGWPGGGALQAQNGTHDLSLRNVPVATALEELVSRTGISLVYASEVVRGKRTVCRVEGAGPEELLRCVVTGAGLDFYRLSSGTYVVISGPEALPAYGSVSGQIVDAITGEPLPDASVELADGSLGARTNGAGMFVLARLLPGPHQLLVSQPGYQSLRLPLEVLASGNTRRQIRLDPAVLELDPIVVEGIRDVGGGALNETGWRAGDFAQGVPLDGEISQQARTGLGVSRRPLFADLSIQGSAPGEHTVRLDGVPVFDPVSLGRSRSAFSPLALRRITVRKAGFGVEHGSFSGGVIDVEHALADRAGGGISALADPYAVNADISLPVALLGGEGTVMVAGRSSIWSLYREHSLDQTLRDWNQVDPILMGQLARSDLQTGEVPEYDLGDRGSSVGFSDLHGALRLEFPGFRTLQASFYRGTNDVSTELITTDWGGYGESPTRHFYTRDAYAWSNTAGQLRLDWLLGDRASMQLRGWGSRHELDHAYGMADVASQDQPNSIPTLETSSVGLSSGALRPPMDDENQIQEWGLSASGDLVAGGSHFLSGGVEGVRVQSRARLQNGFLRALLFQDLEWRWAAFLQDRWRVTDRLTLEGGMRVTTVGGGASYLEPRLSARMDGSNPTLGPWSLQVAGGVYHQYLNQFGVANVGPSALVPEVQFWLPVDGSTEPTRSRHLAAEFAARPWRGWELRGEAYYKWLDRILALDYGTLVAATTGPLTELEQADFVAPAEGMAYGAGARLGWEQGRARAELAYDWSVSERTHPSRFDGARQPAPWSEPHRLVFQGRLPVWGGLAVDAESRTVWGRTWALRRAYYDVLALHEAGAGLPIGLPGEDRLPTLHQLDLGLSWLGHLGDVLTEFRAEVRNAQWERQVLDYSLIQQEGPGGETVYQRRPRLLPGPALFLSARIGF